MGAWEQRYYMAMMAKRRAADASNALTATLDELAGALVAGAHAVRHCDLVAKRFLLPPVPEYVNCAHDVVVGSHDHDGTIA